MNQLVRVCVEDCIKQHVDAHQILLWDYNADNVEALACKVCQWILQKQNDEWQVKQTFRK